MLLIGWWGFTAEKYIVFERTQKNSPCNFDNMTREKNVLKHCQSSVSTNHGERGVVLQRLIKQM